jgi:hypothetical protein
MGPREQTTEVLREHSGTFVDQDGDTRCECGKWLEPGEHEWDWHVAGLVVEALGLEEQTAFKYAPLGSVGNSLILEDLTDIKQARKIAGDTHQLTEVSRWVSGWSVVGEPKP